MATPTWIEYGERATADNDPVYGAQGIVNRPAREAWNNFIVEHGVDGVHAAAALNPTGAIQMFGGKTAPTGWLLCDGSDVSRTTYATLFNTIAPSVGTMTVTIATPAVISLTAHGLAVDESFYITTTGALPTGMSANTLYYVISAGYGADSFRFSATRSGSAVNTSGSQSGTHTLRFCPYGLGDGSTTFNVPDMRSRSPMGAGQGSGLTARGLGVTVGEESHALTSGENGSHTHTGGAHTHTEGWHTHSIADHTHTGGAHTHDGPEHTHTVPYELSTGTIWRGHLQGGTGSSTPDGNQNTGSAGGGSTSSAGAVATSGSGTLYTNSAAGTGTGLSGNVATTSSGSGTAHNTVHPVFVVNYIIKY